MGNLLNPALLKWSGNVASRPFAFDLQSGDVVYFQDYPVFVGSYWRVAGGIVYSPLASQLVIAQNPAEVVTELSTDEQVVFSATMPAGLSFDSVSFQMLLDFQKAAGDCTIRVRVGAEGLGGVVAFSHSFPGASDACVLMPTLKRLSETSVSVSPGSFIGNAADHAANIVVPNMDTDGTSITVTCQMGDAINAVTMKQGAITYLGL